ncbi:TonB-dependent receptor [Mangrovibacterium marinum]|uniref:TonB-linked SusC/RagA family outer membrane protein n=1 Tax=Mangrovibacterium marinum TaxID=1639118 RepID=A0A2T5BZD7_9BACT|nr:TonB-dependent receptor [Mangrovibacterium marinum]PTN07634.1 TonB-linked SusC/RagA family outer membrane protein [Mangrovibacterium marinum]
MRTYITPCRRLIGMMITLMFLLTGQNLFAQSVKVNGVVKDETGETVIGATVVEKGTTNGAITDFNGEFHLTLSSSDATLQVSFIGYTLQEIALNGQTQFNVVLEKEDKQLDEVVVVGYGAQKKESIVGAISQLSSDEILSSPAANITQAISGKIPGVVTSQTSGAPGADDAQIYIRGRATFAGDGQPLVLVDGVERSFSQIAPDDIQAISVLKDASATAVYGVRGANGVILVTTKRGRDQKPVVSLTANWQSQSPTRENTYLNSYQSVLLLEEALANDNLPSQFSTSDIEMYRKSSAGELSGVDAMLYPNVDWYDTILRSSAPAQRYNVNIQGGTKRMRYFTSGEFYDQQGLYKDLSEDKYGNKSNTSFRRYAFRANLDFLLTQDLTASINFGTRFEERNGPNTSESSSYSEVFYELNHTPGWLFPVSYTIPDGESEKVLYGGSSQYQNNIAARLAKAGFYKATNTISETNFILDYKMDWLTEGLKAKAMMSFDYDGYYNRRFTADFATYELNDRTNYESVDAYNKFNSDTELAYAGNNQTTTWKLYFEYQLNYARKFGKHDVSAMMLYNQNDYRYQAELAQRYQGLVGRVTYGYDDRYLLEVNAGYNGSENFMKGKRFGFFPSFSVGWRISNEEFMSSTEDWLDNLKIRASYGQVGNDIYLVNGVKQRFLYEQKWSQIGNDYYFGTTGYTGIYEGQYPNYGVTWERANKYNLGIEFTAFDRLISGNIDLFSEKRNNILTEFLTRPEWVGVTMAAGNLGETKNSGYEIELKHSNKIGSDFNYNVGLTYAHAKNEIKNMDEPDLKTDYRKREGQSIGQYFGLLCDGFITAADLANPDLPISTYGDVQVGDLKYRDMNSDGFIDDRDETMIGFSNVPENTYSLTLGCDYKGWGFSVMFQGVDHVSRYYDAEAMYAFVDGGKVKEHHLNRWDPSQTEAYNLANAKYPLLHYDSNGDHNQQLNSYFLQNGAFVRLKNIEVSYTLPKRWIKTVGMSDCRLYVNANNLITWDHLDDVSDPESNGSNRYPIMKTVNCGVNLKF